MSWTSRETFSRFRKTPRRSSLSERITPLRNFCILFRGSSVSCGGSCCRIGRISLKIFLWNGNPGPPLPYRALMNVEYHGNRKRARTPWSQCRFQRKNALQTETQSEIIFIVQSPGPMLFLKATVAARETSVYFIKRFVLHEVGIVTY